MITRSRTLRGLRGVTDPFLVPGTTVLISPSGASTATILENPNIPGGANGEDWTYSSPDAASVNAYLNTIGLALASTQVGPGFPANGTTIVALPTTAATPVVSTPAQSRIIVSTPTTLSTTTSGASTAAAASAIANMNPSTKVSGSQGADDIVGNYVYLKDNNGNTVTTNSMIQLSNWLAAGYTPLRSDGTAGTVQVIDGGYIIDGNPLNVWLGVGWIAGQQTYLAPLVLNGTVPAPTIDLTKVYVRGGTGTGLFGLSWAELLGLGAVGWLVFGGSKRRS